MLNAGAEGLLGDLIQDDGFLRVFGDLLGQHLGVGGNHRQWSVHFVRHARRQQPDAAELVGLHRALFQFRPVGHVVEVIRLPICSWSGHQRRDRDIQGRLAELPELPLL